MPELRFFGFWQEGGKHRIVFLCEFTVRNSHIEGQTPPAHIKPFKGKIKPSKHRTAAGENDKTGKRPSMTLYRRDFPTDRPEHWHDEAAQRGALDALEAGDLAELEKIFKEARGLSLKRILREIIKEKL